MSTPNIGWLYYKDYLRIYENPVRLFEDAPKDKGEKRNDYFEEHFNKKNDVILGKSFEASTSTQLQIVTSNQKLKFKTIYPGLTQGTGYTHETGEMGEFKLGFFFDYSTGYPCIPGSTVKGCLRSRFPQHERENVADKSEKYDYLATIIRDLPDLPNDLVGSNDLGEEFDQNENIRRKQFIDTLEKEIFDGQILEKNEDGSPKMKDSKIVFQPLCIYDRDIFFDGYIVSTNHPAIYRSTYQNLKPFIADDYITPHLNRKKPELSPFTNPLPLMFLKILPEVNIQFQFDLKDGILSRQAKEELFRILLLDFGVGAKTNVGYGQFEEGFTNEPVEEVKTIQRTEPLNFIGRIKSRESLVEAKVLNQKTNRVSMKINGQDIEIIMSGHCPAEGTLVKVLITDIDKKTGKIKNVKYQGDIR